MNLQAITVAASLAALVVAVCAAASTLISAWQVRKTHRAAELSAMLDLSRRFDEVYKARNKLLHEDCDLSWDYFHDCNPSRGDKLNSDIWLTLRQYAGFMEFVAVLVKRRWLDSNILFKWMPMDREVWDKAQPLIDRMRPMLRDDLWCHWPELLNSYTRWDRRS
ncbi:MAG: hypothetical protein R6X16_00435 [Anaerolineae bacterium]